jgi:biopolymer transport protein TolQ
MNSNDLSILSLVTNASLLVQVVMVLLLLISLTSWTIIFRKYFAIRAAQSATNAFESEFWRGAELNSLYQNVSTAKTDPGPLARIFEAGMKEFRRARQRGTSGAASNANSGDSATLLDPSSRAMRAAFQREMDSLESSLAFLASAGSVSPYIGLFGTVWGIMNAFRGLANVQQATLAAVAPGIAEALVATAIGLFAAIPAVVAYNRYSYDIDRLANRFETFTDEFSNILHRHAR